MLGLQERGRRKKGKYGKGEEYEGNKNMEQKMMT
jgi:hypothetical protein